MDKENEEGVWRTVGGRRIFIRNGQSLSDAMVESGKFSRNKPNSRWKNVTDVSEEYLQQPRPKRSRIKKDKNFIEKDHIHENKVVNYLYDKFGGRFRQIQEIQEVEGIKFPDFWWKERFWEIKKVTTLNAIDNGCRKALTQIHKNGGIILDVYSNSLKDEEIINQVGYRLNRSGGKCDVIILRDTNELVAVLRKK